MKAVSLLAYAVFSYCVRTSTPAIWLGAEARCRDGSGLARYVAASRRHPNRMGLVEAMPRAFLPRGDMHRRERT